MDDASLKALLASQKLDALAAISAANLSQDRADALDYYLGDMSKDLPAADGRSSAVSSDVADTIEGLMPSLMDIFCGNDEVVKFEPVGEEDEEAAQQETDYVNHVFMQQNPGFMVLYSFIKDALLSKVGIVKVFWDEREQTEKETYHDLTEDQFALVAQGVLQSDGGLEITAHTEKPGAEGQPATHDVEITSTKMLAHAKVMPVPPEEFGIERGARTIRDCNYCFHEVVTKTEAQLIAEGFDETQVKALSPYTGNTGVEELARDSVQEHLVTYSGMSSAARLVKVTEHYIRMDYEDNGKPCLYQVVTGGEQGELLKRDGKPAVEEFDTIPFAAVTPVPITHRFFGRSIADLVMDIQRVKTALMRGMLDNLYLHNNPRVEVAESMAGPNTLDDLLVSRPGGIVRTKNPGGMQWQVVPDITGSVYPALEYMDSTREMRTGVTKQGQGIDANALQNQSATAVNQMFSVSQMRMKLIARIIAETGVKDLFSLLHGVIRKHGQEAQTVRLRNTWVQVDPRNWKTRNDMTIHVGLGTGGKAEQFGQTMQIASAQEKLLLGGKSNIVDDQKLFNTAAQLAKLAGHKNPDQFFNDPSAKDPKTGQPMYPPAPPPPNPEMIKAQASIQQAQMQAQLDERSDQRKAQIEQVQAQADVATQDRKTQAEMVQSQQEYQLKEKLAIMEFELQRQLKMAELELSRELHQQTLAHNQQMHEHSLAQGQFSMVAGAEKHDQAMKQMKAKPKATAK